MRKDGWEYIDIDPSNPTTSSRFSKIQGYSKGGKWIGGIANNDKGSWSARGWKCYGDSFPDPFTQADLGEFEDEEAAKHVVEKWAVIFVVN